MNRRSWILGCALVAYPGRENLVSRSALAASRIESPASAGPDTVLLPLFPLDIVAFPGQLVFLHIYEPRYRQLINECAEDGILFGIVTLVPGGVSSIGTEMKLEDILQRDDSGNMNVAIRGVRTFQLLQIRRVVEGKLYSAGRVSFNGNDPLIEPETQAALVQLYNLAQERADIPRKIVTPAPENLSFRIAHDVGLTPGQKLQLLTIATERDRQLYLMAHLQRHGIPKP
jgi:Lon protease-like protein